MSESRNIIEKLKSSRAKNVQLLVGWVDSDLQEMLDTYLTARIHAVGEGEAANIEILDEKISQLREAKSLRGDEKSSTYVPPIASGGNFQLEC